MKIKKKYLQGSVKLSLSPKIVTFLKDVKCKSLCSDRKLAAVSIDTREVHAKSTPEGINPCRTYGDVFM